MLKGIDVSKWQKGIDWRRVAAAGNVFAFAKATDGLGIDPCFLEHRAGVMAMGLTFGAYHFFRFDIDPALQARHFAKVIGDTKGELSPVIDVEWDKTSRNYGEGKMMDDDAAAMVQCFCTILKLEIQRTPIVYTNPYFWDAGEMPMYWAGNPLWVPNYHAKDVTELKIPPPWTKASFWQFSESINDYGVDKVDGDYFLGTMGELEALVQG